MLKGHREDWRGFVVNKTMTVKECHPGAFALMMNQKGLSRYG